MQRFCLISCCIILCSIGTQAQSAADAWREEGIPYIQNYSPKEYGASAQIWCVDQDENGIMYFGSNSGLLEFDGTHWRVNSLPQKTPVRSIGIEDGRIYVGSRNEVGYFSRSPEGILQYYSLVDRIPEENRNFNAVWNIYPTGDTLYFRTSEYVFRFSSGKTDIWLTETRFHQSFFANKTFYIFEKNTGMKYIQGNDLKLAPSGEFFKDKYVYTFFPFDEENYFLTTRLHGSFLYDLKSLKPFPMKDEVFLSRCRTIFGTAIGDGLFALATTKNGLVIFDRAGNIRKVINTAAGIREDFSSFVFKDRENGIWLAMNNGISRIDALAPTTRYTRFLGLNGTIIKTMRYKGRLYAVATGGLFVLDEENPQRLMSNAPEDVMGKAYFPTFKPMFQIQNQTWDLKEVDGELLLGYYGGLASVGGENLDKIHEWRITQPSYIHQLNEMPQYMFVGLWRGLSIMKKVNGRWTYHRSIDTIKNRVVNIVDMGNHTYWIAMYTGQAYRLKLNNASANDPFENIDLTLFGQDEGIPLNNVHAVLIDDQLKLGTQGGLKAFDEEKQRFVPDYSLGDQFADTTTWIYYINQYTDNEVWIVAGNGPDIYNGKAVKQEDGSYSWYDTPYLRMNDMGDMYHIRPETDGRIWFSGSEGIALYSPQDARFFDIPYSTKVRDVIDIRTGSSLQDKQSELNSISLPHENNSIRLNFSALTYHSTEANRFQFKLDGFDENWSEWTSENRKDYTGIFEGDYTFRVRSKNIYHQIGEEAALNISVSPPWFRSMAAYFIYLLLGGGLIFALMQTRVQRYKKQQERLENMITERTAQIVEQRNQLAVQSEKLKELDELKSQFFANISHEFRTPLTLIIGMIDNLKKQAAESSSAKELELIEQNAGRLLNLINQLLDLSKLEAGELKIAAAENDIARFIRRIYASFASLAPQRNITMTLNHIPFEEAKEDSITAWYDTDRLEKVFYNLLSNAFKFTPKNGRVDLSYSMNTDSSEITIIVLNTGPGIPPEKLPHIFERFYQVEGSSKREFEGTGIGLALVKELVELHHGSVYAASDPDSGTTFTITLPITRAAFDDSEIQESLDTQTATTSIPNLAALSADDPYATEDASDTEIDETDSDKTLVLIVEDHRDLRRFIRENLEEEFSVIEAENGRIGVEKAIARIPDLIISDVMMPEMDGYELCASLKTNEKTDHIPIILLTAKAATDDKMEGLQIGADDYLLKPFNPEELQVRVRNLIKIRRQMRDKFSNEMLLRPTDITVSSVHQVFLEKVTGIIESHMDDEEFSVEGLANEVGMSRGQLHRKLKALTNQSTSEFIRNFRLQRAAELIKQNAGNIAEIAYEVGFSSQAYFTRCFQEQFNCSPTEYRKRNK